jgi:hypothetical protein
MSSVYKSQASNVFSPQGNSLAVFVDGITNRLILKDALGNTEPITNYIPETGVFGSFYDTTTQTASGDNIPTPMKYNMTDVSNGVSIINDTKITVAQTGYYNIQFSAQLDRVSGSGVVAIDIWLRKNGFDVPHSNTKVTMMGNANQSKIVAAWNFIVQLNAGENAELVWLTPTTNIKIVAEPANLVIPYPEIPSVILTVIKI